MILTPPFYLAGEAGASLGEEGYALEKLGVVGGLLTQRSLSADTLQFSIRDNGSRPAIPDDGQWITLRDDNGQVLFTGIAKRTYQFPECIYSYIAANVYQGLGETPLLGDDFRPYLLYSSTDLADRILDLLARAQRVGLPIQPPAAAEMPTLFLAPKMGFRAATYASAIEETLKWVPDVSSRMDYSTTVPKLRFFCRSQTTPLTLDLESDNHKATAITLTPSPETRALGLSITFQRRDGNNNITSITQSAGDLTAEARRQLSVFLSGQERSDLLANEALLSAQTAILKVNQLITATGASVTAVADAALINLTFDGLKSYDSNLQAAVTAQPGFTMGASAGSSYTLYTGIGIEGGSPWIYTTTMPTKSLALRTITGALATGWYPIKSGSFSDADLATAGATKETRYITGDFVTSFNINGSAGATVLLNAGAGNIQGWTSNYAIDSAHADAYWRKYVKWPMNISVEAINMSPSAVAAAVNAALNGAAGNSAFINRAEFVDAPDGLAQNYFERQDWTPFKGTIALSPSVSNIPVPGDFINITGTNTPAEWATMAAPVASTEIDLSTGMPKLTIGPSPRQDYRSLIDRLRIPVEDNYQAG